MQNRLILDDFRQQIADCFWGIAEFHPNANGKQRWLGG